MNKLYSFLAFASMALGVSAQNELQVLPEVIDADGGYVYWTFNNPETDGQVIVLELIFQWPEGWDIDCPEMDDNDVKARTATYDSKKKKWSQNFTCADGDPSANNTIKYSCYSTTAVPLAGSEGLIAAVFVTPPADVKPGVYPVTLKAGSYFATSGVAGSEIWLPEQTSYIVVGEPKSVALSLTGEIPSFVNEALVDEAAVASLDLTAVTAINGDFTYVDGRAVTAPTDELEVSAKYAKTLAQGKYASLTLPFDATFGDETAYKFMEVEGEYAKFDAVTSAQAGEVVLLTKSVNLTGSKLSSVAGTTATKAYYVSQDGTELRQGTNVNVPALRGVWEIEGANSNLRIMLDGIATDIKMSDLVGEGAQAFDLQGRRTANAKNGVYVVNGKKQIVK